MDKTAQVKQPIASVNYEQLSQALLEAFVFDRVAPGELLNVWDVLEEAGVLAPDWVNAARVAYAAGHAS